MTKLLVSVRDAAEAQIAVTSGADLVDVKEPGRGSLGAADAATIRAVVEQVAGRVPISAALGELEEGRSLDPSLAGDVRYAKYGLAGFGRKSDWLRRWKAAIDGLPRGVVGVAVVYADWRRAAAPEPWEVISRAAAIGCGAVLIDTFDKTRGSLVRQMPIAQLARWVAAVRADGLVSVVAGSLRAADFDDVLALGCNYLAVRGAACAGDRTGHIERERVQRLAALAQGAAAARR
jgi:uncharacterized protein (UPF0264 family)